MQNSFFQAICRMGIFMICVRAIIHFRPQEAYEKYLRLLAGIMVMIQLLLPVGKFILGKGGQEAAEILQQFKQEMERGMEEAVGNAAKADAILEQMTLEEVQRSLEGQEPQEKKQAEEEQDLQEKNQTEEEQESCAQDVDGRWEDGLKGTEEGDISKEDGTSKRDSTSNEDGTSKRYNTSREDGISKENGISKEGGTTKENGTEGGIVVSIEAIETVSIGSLQPEEQKGNLEQDKSGME